MKIKHFPLLCILWLALAVRVWGLLNAPPGLTHDEANHGREAMSLLDGQLTFYFPLNYGSEPLYSYTVAGSMALLGESIFALRFVGAMFGVLTIALSYSWVKQVWGEQPGRWVALLMAGSYWAIVSSRMALRATLLPFFMLAAIYAFWHILRPGPKQWFWAGWFGFFIAVTLHIYLAARLLWLVFPLMLLILWVNHRPLFWQSWRPVTAGLCLAALLVTPLFVYLQLHPEADTRLEMFSVFNSAQAGDFRPLFSQIWGGFSAFFWPGSGDQFLAYNIPGRPVFDPLTAGLAAVGAGVALWHWRDPRYNLLLVWLVVGIAPSLITGATANTTRNVGALPAIYLLPVLGAYTLFSFPVRPPRFWQLNFFSVGELVALLWLAGVGLTSGYAYFGTWANLPEVRGAYQTTIMAAMITAESQNPARTPLLFSSVYPGAAHDNSIGMVLLKDKERSVRWMDVRLALIWPAGENFPLFVPSSTPLHPHFEQWVSQATTHPLRSTDLDPSFTAYTLTPPVFKGQLANFNEGVQLITAYWLAEEVPAGGVAELVTVWRVLDPGRVGPLVPPAYQTDAVMFAQVLRPEGTVLTQADYLMAPSWGWQTGDTVVQIFQMSVPGETPAGNYQTIVGVYDRTSGTRLNVVETGQSFAPISDLMINQP